MRANYQLPSPRSLLCAILVTCLVAAASSESFAGEGAKSDRSLVWRPVRPAEQRAEKLVRNARPQDARPQSASTTGTNAATTARRVNADPYVKQVVLQQPADPLANPFNDPMPASPFNGAAPQAAPADTSEPPADTQPGPADATNNQAPPPNPFAPDPSQPGSAQEPGPLPDADRAAPYAGDGGFGSQLQPPPEFDIPAGDPKKDCQEALRNLRANRLTLARSRTILDLRPQETGDLPYECTLGGERLALDSGRSWPETCYTWKASGLCHKPLYFEQSHMERYGHSWGPVLDSVISGAHFFASVPVLPYKMGLQPPCECVYPLGHYRPGSCAPRYIEPWPMSIRGGAVQAAAVTGLVFAVP